MPHPTFAVELASLGVLALFLWVEARRGDLAAVAPLALTLVGAAWVAEDTCIRWYGFYAYRPEWHLFLDRMPLMVAVIWPFVILSDRRVVEGVVGAGHPAIPVWTGLWVFWDACLMETVAVKAGLWAWTEPGLFGVPLIGVMGWGLFTGAALGLWQGLPQRWRWATVLLAPLLTHLLLLGTWWGALRWMLRGPFPDGAVVAAGWITSAALVAWLWWRRVRVDLAVMGPRIPAATVFLGLLLWKGAGDGMLMAFAASFVPPYLVATRWPGRGGLSGGG